MDLDFIRESVESYFWKEPIVHTRNITLRTNTAGMDMFEEAMEGQSGFKRVYIGKKVLRILRVVNKNIKKNRLGNYYKLVKNG